jgi:hypothetical protein
LLTELRSLSTILTCFVTHDFNVNWRKKCLNSILKAPIVRLPIVYAFPQDERCIVLVRKFAPTAVVRRRIFVVVLLVEPPTTSRLQSDIFFSNLMTLPSSPGFTSPSCRYMTRLTRGRSRLMVALDARFSVMTGEQIRSQHPFCDHHFKNILTLFFSVYGSAMDKRSLHQSGLGRNLRLKPM